MHNSAHLQWCWILAMHVCSITVVYVHTRNITTIGLRQLFWGATTITHLLAISIFEKLSWNLTQFIHITVSLLEIVLSNLQPHAKWILRDARFWAKTFAIRQGDITTMYVMKIWFYAYTYQGDTDFLSKVKF